MVDVFCIHIRTHRSNMYINKCNVSLLCIVHTLAGESWTNLPGNFWTGSYLGSTTLRPWHMHLKKISLVKQHGSCMRAMLGFLSPVSDLRIQLPWWNMRWVHLFKATVCIKPVEQIRFRLNHLKQCFMWNCGYQLVLHAWHIECCIFLSAVSVAIDIHEQIAPVWNLLQAWVWWKTASKHTWMFPLSVWCLDCPICIWKRLIHEMLWYSFVCGWRFNLGICSASVLGFFSKYKTEWKKTYKTK